MTQGAMDSEYLEEDDDALFDKFETPPPKEMKPENKG